MAGADYIINITALFNYTRSQNRWPKRQKVNFVVEKWSRIVKLLGPCSGFRSCLRGDGFAKRSFSDTVFIISCIEIKRCGARQPNEGT